MGGDHLERLVTLPGEPTRHPLRPPKTPTRHIESLVFGVWTFSGAWSLGFGVFPLALLWNLDVGIWSFSRQ
jgi:hypothetical protein